MTAYAQRSEINKFLGAGMTAAIVKPVSRTRLRELLGTLAGTAPAQGDDGGAGVDMDTLHDLVAALGHGRVAAILGQVDAEVQALAGALDRIDAGGTVRDAAAQQAHRLAGAVALIGARGLRDRLASLESAVIGGAGAEQVAAQSWAIAADWARIRAKAERALAGEGAAARTPATPGS
ncbi:Hpt domain-containing protein [Albidovulum sediminis]|uniref:Hpt domain-containing protein n=1 Tax=Albidovulum sediminis TaxID=3066345 RepID=UPI0021C13E29